MVMMVLSCGVVLREEVVWSSSLPVIVTSPPPPLFHTIIDTIWLRPILLLCNNRNVI